MALSRYHSQHTAVGCRRQPQPTNVHVRTMRSYPLSSSSSRNRSGSKSDRQVPLRCLVPNGSLNNFNVIFGARSQVKAGPQLSDGRFCTPMVDARNSPERWVDCACGMKIVYTNDRQMQRDCSQSLDAITKSSPAEWSSSTKPSNDVPWYISLCDIAHPHDTVTQSSSKLLLVDLDNKTEP